jgi:hypothetical protein
MLPLQNTTTYQIIGSQSKLSIKIRYNAVDIIFFVSSKILLYVYEKPNEVYYGEPFK